MLMFLLLANIMNLRREWHLNAFIVVWYNKIVALWQSFKNDINITLDY